MFDTPQFKRGDILYMWESGFTYLLEILNIGSGSFGYDAQYLINTWNPENTFVHTWVGPLTLHTFKATKIL